MPAAYLLGERGEHHLIGWNVSSGRVGLESAELTAGPTLPRRDALLGLSPLTNVSSAVRSTRILRPRWSAVSPAARISTGLTFSRRGGSRLAAGWPDLFGAIGRVNRAAVLVKVPGFAG
jgi:hypothetical protein